MTIDVGEVGMIKVSEVIVEDRARVELGNLQDLESNLKDRGLIAPVAVKKLEQGYKLLAGERRFTVIRGHNGPDSLISARIYTRDLSPLEMKEIEMSENFYRKDMEYWEYDKLTAEIHSMKQAIHGAAAPGPGHEDAWTGKDTGALLGITNASVSTALKRNEAREQFPELFESCRSASDATKVMAKLEENITREVIAQKLEAKKATTKLQELSKRFIIKDFFEGVKELPDNYFHLVEIDPPYAVSFDSKLEVDKPSKYDTRDYNEISSDKYETFLSDVFTAVYRVMAEHSWLIVWFACEPWFETVYKSLRTAGFSTTRLVNIWAKPTARTLHPQIQPAPCYEPFFHARKGKPVLNKPGHRNVYDILPIPAQQKVHPTERPIELMQAIYDNFAFQGSRVLIPFLGSGNGIISAFNLGMDALGFEKSKGYRDSFLLKVNSMKG